MTWVGGGHGCSIRASRRRCAHSARIVASHFSQIACILTSSPHVSCNIFMIRTTHLIKRYGSVTALNDVSVAIPKGSIYGLVGANGAGKTTLLAILAGLLQATEGTLDRDAPGSRIGFCPDVPEFEPWLTPREVLRLACGLRKHDADEARISTMLAQVGLDSAMDRRVEGFSRGMTQRLAVATALIDDPSVIVLDEPCSALDPEGRAEILSLIGTYQRKASVILSSHVLSDVQQICTNIGVLQQGSLIWQGKLDTLLRDHVKPVWRVRLHGGAAAVAIVLRSQPWVLNVTEHGNNEIEIEASSLAHAEEQMAPVLSRAHAALVALEPVGSDLENILERVVTSITTEKKKPSRRPVGTLPTHPAPDDDEEEEA